MIKLTFLASTLFIVGLLLTLLSSASASQEVSITDCVDLQNMNFNLTASYIVINDIDCRNTILWNGGAGFIPIGSGSPDSFCGILDAQNYAIERLFINRPDEDQIGLFARLCAVASLRSIVLLDITITGNQYVGGLVGENYGSISNASVSGAVTGSYVVGGVVGYDAGPLKQVEFIGEVLGQIQTQRIGGLIGTLSGTLNQGFVHANVTGNYRIGGVIGESNGQANNVQFIGYVTGVRLSLQVGGLIGFNVGIISDAKIIGTITGVSTVGGVCGLNGGDITFSEFIGDVIGTGISQEIGGFVGDQAPDGFVSNSKASGRMEGKQFVGGFAGSNFGVLESITFDGEVVGVTQNQQIGGLIGNNGNTGSLIDGRAYGIVSGELAVGGVVGGNYGNISFVEFSGTIISYAPARYVGGLAGFLQQSAARLSHATCNAIINGSELIGGVVGRNNGLVENVAFTGTIVGEKDSFSIGGAVGYNERTIQNLRINALIKTQGRNAGGAVGENSYTGILENVTIIVDLVATGNRIGGVAGINLGNLYYCRVEGSVQANSYVGGIAGSNGISGVIAYTYTNVNVTAQADYAGGLIGYHEGVLAFSYSLSPVTANQTAGSLVGYFDGRIQECYSAGCVTASSQIGGLVGSELVEDQSTQSYWNLDTTGQRYPAGQDYDAVLDRYGLTTEQMLSSASFKLWDYEEIWDQQPGLSFPYLKNFAPNILPSAPTLACPMEPLPYDHWMNPIAIFLFSHFLVVLIILIARRIQFQNQLHAAFNDTVNWKFSSIRMGNVSLMNYLENEISQEQAYDYEGYSPLELAALSDAGYMIQYWLAKLDSSQTYPKQAAYAIAKDLHYAASMVLLKSDDQDGVTKEKGRVSKSVKRTKSINENDDDSMTAPLLDEDDTSPDQQLYIAAIAGNLRKVKQCLIEGAEPNRRNQEGILPIFPAALRRHTNIVLLLIEYGANPFLRNAQQQTIVEFLFALNLGVVARTILFRSTSSITWSLSKQIYLKALADNSQYLTELNLSGHGLNDKDFVRFSAALQGNSFVKKFNVAYNQITGHGLLDSAHLLVANQTLATLDLRCNQITLKGASDFKSLLTQSSCEVLLSGNLLIPHDQQDWQSLPVTTNLHYQPLSETLMQAKLVWQHFHLTALMGSFLVVANRVASGYLIQAFDEEEDHTHLWLTLGLLVLGYLPGIYALGYFYGGWQPRDWRDGVQGLLLLPVLSPELLSFIYQAQSPDILHTLLEMSGLACDILIALLALTVMTDHKDSQPALFKISMTMLLLLWKFISYAYWRETLKAQWKLLRKSQGRFLTTDHTGDQLIQV